ncbi:MAG: VOC family protein [Actinomycetota bacterium]|jgi:predicted enzyme related to lactoylglutathione lyase|nr:VOC family protein [Actinomycetota bacterium]
MASSLYSVVIDANDHRQLAGFWAEALGYEIAFEADDHVGLEPPGGTGPALEVGTTSDAKDRKNRVHLDLRPDHQGAQVDRLIGLGAQRADVGQSDDVTWVVLADPEGNELCVLRALADVEDPAPLSLSAIAIDCADPGGLGRFWAEALGWNVDEEDDDESAIEPSDESEPVLLFLRVPEPKTAKNRLHLDLNPDDQDAEVGRLEALGAHRVDIGQGDATWVVLADPEGNEFCVLTAR